MMLTRENDSLRFTLDADASGELVDRRTGRVWRMGPVALQERGRVDEGYCWTRGDRYHCEAYGGRFRAEREGEGVRLTVLEEYVGPRGSFHVDFELDGSWLVVRIGRIDEDIPCLTYPTPLECDTLVIPAAQGRLVTENERGSDFGHSMIGFYGGANMRWFGGIRGEGGWIAIIEDGPEYAQLLYKGPVAAPVWIQSLGTWEYPRTVRIGCVEDTYVGMARAFRRYLQARGEFKPLSAKIEEKPALSRLVGGRGVAFMMAKPYRPSSYEDFWVQPPRGDTAGMEVNFTFKQCAEIIADCKRLGMARGHFKLDGWYQGGYDAMHPAIWPPVPELGSLEEFQAIARQPDPYVCMLHDNYNDTYLATPGFPEGTCRTREGHPLVGGRWAGGLAYMMNTRDSLKAARANAAHYHELGNAAIYCDTLPGRPHESWEPGNRLTRSQDIDYRRQIVELFRREGMFVGGEDGSDYVMKQLDCIPVGKHSRDNEVAVPLLSMVYHDSVIGFRALRSPNADGSMGHSMRQRCLENLLWGWMNVFRGFTRRTWPQWRTCFQQSSFVDDWHGKIATDEMVNHVFVTPDRQVERTEWSSGRSITVNFGDEPFTADGTTIKPQGFHIDE